MEFILSGEIYAATGIEQLNHKYIDLFMAHFKTKLYSPQLKRIFAIFICRPGGPYTQRRRFNAEKSVFMIDIMLDYNYIMRATPHQKEKHYLESFNQIYPLLKRYAKKIEGLKVEAFKTDLDLFLQQFMPKEAL